jgi:hypothetical protein
MPTEYPLTNPSGAIAAGNEASRDRASREAGLSQMFGQILGQRPTLASMTPSAADAITMNPELF